MPLHCRSYEKIDDLYLRKDARIYPLLDEPPKEFGIGLNDGKCLGTVWLKNPGDTPEKETGWGPYEPKQRSISRRIASVLAQAFNDAEISRPDYFVKILSLTYVTGKKPNPAFQNDKEKQISYTENPEGCFCWLAFGSGNSDLFQERKRKALEIDCAIFEERCVWLDTINGGKIGEKKQGKPCDKIRPHHPQCASSEVMKGVRKFIFRHLAEYSC